MFESILSSSGGSLTVLAATECTMASLFLGLIIATCYYFTGRGTKNFCAALVVLPAMVQIVIMLVNGSLGTGMAIVGAFSLIRFRSLPGNSHDISCIFFAMVIGLATGMGYITYAVFVTLIIGAVMVILHLVPLPPKTEKRQELKITIYEDLDYTDIFNDLFEEYLVSYELKSVKTVNMGSMYEIDYLIEQKDRKREKEMIDAIRCRNGNLTIVCRRMATPSEQL
ncbi:MAG TPA: DUF4956 domain-containing protein [Lachnospiraceae bacterium]|nr:DUF4956 domain-containing protein [Lachnospiraceae bacterium]